MRPGGCPGESEVVSETSRKPNRKQQRKEELDMAISDQLSKLAARTKELEDRATAARQEARADLQRDVAAAREASNANAEALSKSLDESEAEVSAWWTQGGRSWD